MQCSYNRLYPLIYHTVMIFCMHLTVYSFLVYSIQPLIMQSSRWLIPAEQLEQAFSFYSLYAMMFSMHLSGQQTSSLLNSALGNITLQMIDSC